MATSCSSAALGQWVDGWVGAFITTCHKLCVCIIIMCVGRCGNIGMFDSLSIVVCHVCILYDFVVAYTSYVQCCKLTIFLMGKNGFSI